MPGIVKSKKKKKRKEAAIAVIQAREDKDLVQGKVFIDFSLILVTDMLSFHPSVSYSLDIPSLLCSFLYLPMVIRAQTVG